MERGREMGRGREREGEEMERERDSERGGGRKGQNLKDIKIGFIQHCDFNI